YHSDRAGQRVLPDVEEPDRGNGARLALHPGGFRPCDWPGGGGLDESPFDLTPIATAERNGRLRVARTSWAGSWSRHGWVSNRPRPAGCSPATGNESDRAA